MSARRSPALMALVADLAQLGDDDVQAILDDLDPGSRNRLVQLIERYREGELPTQALPSAQTSGDLVLSAWLSDRLAVNDEARSTGLTPHASETLRRIAREHGWTPPSPARSVPPQRPGLAALFGRGA